MSLDEIVKLIPHRKPMLLLDEIVELGPREVQGEATGLTIYHGNEWQVEMCRIGAGQLDLCLLGRFT